MLISLLSTNRIIQTLSVLYIVNKLAIFLLIAHNGKLIIKKYHIEIYLTELLSDLLDIV